MQGSLRYYQQKYYDSANALKNMRNRYNELKEKCRLFLQALEHSTEAAKLFTEKVKQLFLLREHRNEPKKKDKSVLRLEEISVVWKDKHLDYTHNLMT